MWNKGGIVALISLCVPDGAKFVLAKARSWSLGDQRIVKVSDEGRKWVIDFEIEKYFDTVNHDKLISILIGRMNDAVVLI